MFVLNPDPYSLPCYRIGPFQTKDLSLNCNLPVSDAIDEYFTDRFTGSFTYTLNGRSAINLALSYYKLKQHDVVTILTTSGNFYISGCVTKEIEKFCRWSRTILPETKVIFINHEFGYPYESLSEIIKTNIPIIEDCAGSFFSTNIDKNIGKVGDFAIYSFPKMFPIQIGGLLVDNTKEKFRLDYNIDRELVRYIKNVLSYYITDRQNMIDKRMENYIFLRDLFKSIGYSERFILKDGIVPAVFMFSSDSLKLNLPELKKYYYSHGVQCSVFYGEESFFIPAHQSLNKLDLQYFSEIMKSFCNANNIG